MFRFKNSISSIHLKPGMKNRIKNASLQFLIFILYSCCMQSQEYSFKNYLEDDKILNHIESFESLDQLDSIKFYFNKYKDNLRYHRYLYTSILLNSKDDARADKYLDSAFRVGLALRCLPKKLFKKLDVDYVNASYKKNYLKGFDARSIELFDSIRVQDQKHRALFSGSAPRARDSLFKLQDKIDSSNFVFYKKFLAQKGFPGIKKTGINICSYAPPSPELVVLHLKLSERPFQIDLITGLIEACKKQEEDWKNVISLMTNLYFRSNHHFSDFNFLKVTHNKLNVDESLFSLYCMTDWLIKSSSDKIVIMCKDEHLFESIKAEMVKMNDEVKLPPVDEVMSKKFHIAIPKKLDSTSFAFEPSTDMEDDKVLFKYVRK